VNNYTLAIELAPSPINGKHPDENDPWASHVFHDQNGEPIEEELHMRQYFVDSSGAPVRTTDGRLVHLLYREDGEPARTADGGLIYIAVDPPPGARV
jgi:hypothetical protein